MAYSIELMIRSIALLFVLAIASCGNPVPPHHESESPLESAPRHQASRNEIDEEAQIANLIDPGKLATLKDRAANERVQKITAILITAKADGKNPDEITQTAIRKIGWGGTPKGDLTAAAILRNLDIVEKLGATTPEDIAAMKRGNAATVRKGPYAGDILSVDHIIPRSVAPELDNVIANLELMPLPLNQRKGNSIGQRQRDLAKKLHEAGLLARPTLPE